MILRDYQEEAIAELRRHVGAGVKRLILQASTGAGKTVCAAAMIRACHEKGRRALFIARGRELIKRTSETLWDWKIPHGVIMAGEDDVAMAPVQVASKDTLISWCIKRNKIPLPDADLVFLDESHESLGNTWVKLIDAYPNAVIVGLTATPARSDGRGLGDMYDVMVQTRSTSKLIEEGWLVPAKVFAPYKPNLRGCPRAGADWSVPALAERMNKTQLVGNVVENWKTYGEGRKTFVYACDRRHGLALFENFRAAGIASAYVDGKTPEEERDQVAAKLESGEITVVVNVMVYKQGVDIPCASCCVLVRPTKSLVLYLQMIGRVRRPYPGKERCVILDHSGACFLHGMPDNDIDWVLSPTQKIQKLQEERNKNVPKPICCPKCHCMFTGRAACPNCGHVLQTRPRERQYKNGKLVEVPQGEHIERTLEAAQRYWTSCLYAMANKRRSAGAAAHMFHKRFGQWPWQQQGLSNVPGRDDWKRPITELYPKFAR